jgi:predicted secreted protein
MKTKLSLVIFTITLILITTSCKKSEETPMPAEVKITVQDNGKSLTLTKGQALNISLGNPGDGLYSFDAPQYDPTVLRFVDHLHQGPSNNNVGNYGTDSWDFTALKTGSTPLTITATRGTDKSTTVTMLSNNVAVK